MNLLVRAWQRVTSWVTGPNSQARPGHTGRLPPPAVEELEQRMVLDCVPPNDPFLFTPVGDTVPLAMHIHPHLTIMINGHEHTIPAEIGIQPTGDLPIHTHDNSGLLHIESPVARTFCLADFFAIWGRPFNSQQILRFHADRTHRISMLVDGRPSTAFGSLVLRDGEDIVISYQKIHPSRHRPGRRSGPHAHHGPGGVPSLPKADAGRPDGCRVSGGAG
jgi:hypothetical protein